MFQVSLRVSSNIWVLNEVPDILGYFSLRQKAGNYCKVTLYNSSFTSSTRELDLLNMLLLSALSGLTLFISQIKTIREDSIEEIAAGRSLHKSYRDYLYIPT